MGELVDESSDAVGARAFPLVRAAVAVEADAVVIIRCRRRRRNIPRVRPNRVVGAARSLAAAGVEDKHIIYKSVAVTVILGEVDFVVEKVAGVDNHLIAVHVGFRRPPSAAVSAVISHRLRERYRAVDVELGTEEVVRVLLKEIDRRARTVVVREARLVKHTVEIIVGVVEVKREIGILDENNDSLLVAENGKDDAVTVEEARPLGIALVGSRLARSAALDRALELGALVEPRGMGLHTLLHTGEGSLHVEGRKIRTGFGRTGRRRRRLNLGRDGAALRVGIGIVKLSRLIIKKISIFREVIVMEFVADDTDIQRRTVRLCHRNQAGLRGHSESRSRTESKKNRESGSF